MKIRYYPRIAIMITSIMCTISMACTHAQTTNTTATTNSAPPLDSTQYPTNDTNYTIPNANNTIKCAPNADPTTTSQWLPYGDNGNQSYQAYQQAKASCQANSPSNSSTSK